MKNILKYVLILILLFSDCIAQNYSADTAEPITIGIKYNEATAKIAAFKQIENKIDKNIIKDYLKDINKKENLASMEKEQFNIKDRFLCPFYINHINSKTNKTLISYAITYQDNKNMTFYYNILGNLAKFEIIKNDINNSQYPRKTIGYNRSGNLISVSFEVSENEQFVYDKNGNLIAHWVDNNLIESKNKKFQIERAIRE